MWPHHRQLERIGHGHIEIYLFNAEGIIKNAIRHRFLCLRVSLKQNKSLSNRLFEILCVLYRGGDLCDTNQGTQWQGRIWEVCPNTPQYSQGIPIQPGHPNTALASTRTQYVPIQQPPINKQPSPLQLQRPWTSKDCSSCKTQVYCYLCSTLQAYPSIITFCQFQSQTNNNTFSKSKEQNFTQNNFR